MKLEITNSNYAGTIVKIHNLLPLDNCDNLVAFPIYGFQAIIDKSTKVDEIGVLFTAETQLSKDFCYNNDLYRNKTDNKDKTKNGYIDENRRVKAVKLRGHRSSALFLPLSSLNYLGINIRDFKLGDSFDTINGTEICRKYVIKRQNNDPKNKVRGKKKKFDRVDAKMFPEHLDTDNYFRNSHKLKDDDYISVTVKQHGSSGRFSHILVNRQLNLFEKFLKLIGVKIQTKEYDYVCGSRRVIKDTVTGREYQHYYESDIWNQWLVKIKDLIPKDYIIYGEIIGWAGESAIQKGYTYQIPNGQSELYVYRITKMNPDGIGVDLSWNALMSFCNNAGLKYCPELWRGYHKEFDVKSYLDIKYKESGYLQCLPLDKEAPCDEGVVIRLEGITPYLLKAKSPEFIQYETKQLDKGVVDIETEESL